VAQSVKGLSEERTLTDFEDIKQEETKQEQMKLCVANGLGKWNEQGK
jgi:hypothetical protein